MVAAATEDRQLATEEGDWRGLAPATRFGTGQ
jgi:hypothetical protein